MTPREVTWLTFAVVACLYVACLAIVRVAAHVTKQSRKRREFNRQLEDYIRRKQ